MESVPTLRTEIDETFQELYDTLAGGLRLVAFRALGDADEANEVVQETLVRAYDAVRHGQVPPGTPLGAFVRGIAKHVTADVVRRRVRERRILPYGPRPLEPPTALDVVISREERDAIEGALDSLPADDRKLLEECLLKGRTVAEVANRLRVPAERLRKQKSRALARVRDFLRNRGHTSNPSSDNNA